MGRASTSLVAVVCRSRSSLSISTPSYSFFFAQAHRCFSTSTHVQNRSTSATSSTSSTSALREEQSASVASKISDALSLPRFTIPASQIDLLQEPSDFYAALLAGIGRAKKRIFVSSLYIGKTEVELIQSISDALERNASLEVTILVDALRSTREGPYEGKSAEGGKGAANSARTQSCASLLAGLQREYPDRAHVRLFRAAGLPKWLEAVVGKRFVEGWGLQHMKIYGFDDEVIVSGANLSNDYFTNRKDRYLLVKGHKHLADYLCKLVDTVSAFSYRLTSQPSQVDIEKGQEKSDHHAPYRLDWTGGDGRYSEKEWKYVLAKRVQALTNEWRDAAPTIGEQALSAQVQQQTHERSETVEVVPLLQMGPMGIQDEIQAVPKVLDEADRQSMPSSSDSPHAGHNTTQLDLTTGYFSLNPLYAQKILSTRATSNIITAAPRANGFFGSKGVSRHLPAAYTWLEGRFWGKIQARGRGEHVSIREWSKDGWTYHCKGIWLSEPSEEGSTPRLTLIGSSNFGIRSAQLDLECTLLVDAAKSPQMRKRLAEELERIKKDANDVVGRELLERPERKVHWGVKVAASLIKKML